MKALWIFLTGLLALVVAGCGGNAPFVPTATATTGGTYVPFALAVDDANVGNPGGTVTYRVSVSDEGSQVTGNRNGVERLPVDLTFSGLPVGFSAVANPNPVPRTSASQEVVVTITIPQDADTTSGEGADNQHDIVVTGNDGRTTRTVTLDLTVEAPVVPDFSLQSVDSTLVVPVGESRTLPFSLHLENPGVVAGVNFSTSGLPAGASATFSVNPGFPSPFGPVPVSVSVNAGTAAAGTYDLTIVGNNGSVTRTIPVILIISDNNGGA